MSFPLTEKLSGSKSRSINLLMSFIHDDFLLSNDQAVKLYHEFAKDEPILDFHNHLPPDEIANNRRFENLAEAWLEADHYKWRAMRANGTPEELVTGNGDPKEKFLAWSATIPHTLGNPLYHWTHLELKRCFGIDTLLSPNTAEQIWEQANEKLKQDDCSACGLLERFKVKTLCTRTIRLPARNSISQLPRIHRFKLRSFQPTVRTGHGEWRMRQISLIG